jgi:hypothetical protein
MMLAASGAAPHDGSARSLASSAVLSIARGGVELFQKNHASSLDISRVRMRLEGLTTYATITALLTNGCLRLYSSTRVSKEEEAKKRSTKIGLDVFFLCVVMSVLFGSYTTIVFGLLSLFSKTALGRGYDEQFLEFWAASADVRESGFESFLWSLISFELAFVLSIFLRFDGRRQKILLVVAILITGLSFRRWSAIMNLAAKHLFPLRAEVQY